ncbi:MAG: imidazole glycerol phosphate synthase subunit HisH [Candidatus Omnitrophica bacterium]|nr:imidazole glycerol phosphate synthase subunit HisH [Candidatus Omnitrophota bacterium]
MEKYIWVVDYGLGNLRSVSKALEKVGAKVKVGANPELLNGAQGIVLPGVGAFDAAVNNLKSAGLFQVVLDYLKKDLPFLGICLGFQLLFSGSEEGREPGFGIIEGKNQRFPDTVKVPQIGWNSVAYTRPSPLFSGIPENSQFYFVHSYYGKSPESEIGQTEYGLPFTASLQKGNAFATQFHPEKSGDLGLKLLDNFVKYITPHLHPLPLGERNIRKLATRQGEKKK